MVTKFVVSFMGNWNESENDFGSPTVYVFVCVCVCVGLQIYFCVSNECTVVLLRASGLVRFNLMAGGWAND